MSLGGKVAQVRVARPGVRAFRVVDTSERGDEQWWCAHTSDIDSPVAAGDSIWWQGPYLMWTPKAVAACAKGRSDIRLPRVGYSHRDKDCGYWEPPAGKESEDETR